MRLPLQLYSRAGCHLCEAAQAALEQIAKELASDADQPVELALEVIDIDRAFEADPGADLVERYGERVPVLVAGGREYNASLPRAAIERAIRAALAELSGVEDPSEARSPGGAATASNGTREDARGNRESSGARLAGSSTASGKASGAALSRAPAAGTHSTASRPAGSSTASGKASGRELAARDEAGALRGAPTAAADGRAQPDAAHASQGAATATPDAVTAARDTRTATPDTAPPTPDTALPTPETASHAPDAATSPPHTATAPHREPPATRARTSASASPSARASERWLRHWLLVVNVALGAFLLGAVAAPVLAALGWQRLAEPLYAAYHLACHQWAFRSFFLFGPQLVYASDQFAQLGLDPFSFVGNPALGWKMALCERDVAIYLGALPVGMWYARRSGGVAAATREFRPLGFGAYTLLILPMAVDGFTQLFGWRESTWELRVGTGLLFGIASAWLVLPRLDESLRPQRSAAAEPHAPAQRQAPKAPLAAEPSAPSSSSALRPLHAAEPADVESVPAVPTRPGRYPPAQDSPPACHLPQSTPTSQAPTPASVPAPGQAPGG